MSDVLKVPENVPEEEWWSKHWKAYRLLRWAGFLRWEAWRLRTFPSKPYIDGLIKERRQRLLDAVEAGMSGSDYVESINQEYKKNNWRTSKRVYNDPLKMLREAKRRYSEEAK